MDKAPPPTHTYIPHVIYMCCDGGSRGEEAAKGVVGAVKITLRMRCSQRS